MRSTTARSRELCRGDAERAFRYFVEYVQQTAFYTAGILIKACSATQHSKRDQGFDKFWHCREVMNFPTFIRYMASGEIESEIGCAGHKINTWYALRMFFTQSELLYYGWKPDRIPSIRIDRDELWEHCGDALDFYTSRGLRLPDEVQAALNNKSANADRDLADVEHDQNDLDAPAS